MDEAILRAARPKLQLKGTIRTIEGADQREGPRTAELIKMHGSINWTYCESCQEAKEFDLLQLKQGYNTDRHSYPVIGICKNCGGQRRPLLVPPLAFKFLMFPPLVDIWNTARQRIDEADYLVVVGYSFSEADTYITKIISRAMSRNQKQKMIVVNSDAGLVRRLRKQYNARIVHFDDTRIMQVCEECDKVLPTLLTSMTGGERKSKASNSA